MKEKYKDEIDFRDLIKDPVRLFGWVFPVVIILLVAAGVFYIKNLDEMSFNQIEPVLPPKAVVQDIPMKKGAVLPAVDLKIVKNAPVELLNKGKELYDATCSSCHGTSGKGDGVAGAALNPHPRNFESKDGWTNGRDIVAMYKTLQEGIIKNGMAAYEYIIPEERLAILHYIRTLADFPEITDEQVQDLDLTYGLSEELVTSNQIPIKTAKSMLIEEEYENFKKYDEIEIYLKDNVEKTDVRTFEQFSISSEMVVSALLSNKELMNYDSFKSSVMAGPGNIGLKSNILRLSDSELRNVHSSLVKVIELSN